jgi:hypothetical protein
LEKSSTRVLGHPGALQPFLEDGVQEKKSSPSPASDSSFWINPSNCQTEDEMAGRALTNIPAEKEESAGQMTCCAQVQSVVVLLDLVLSRTATVSSLDEVADLSYVDALTTVCQMPVICIILSPRLARAWFTVGCLQIPLFALLPRHDKRGQQKMLLAVRSFDFLGCGPLLVRGYDRAEPRILLE